jgi:hypothetical protein
MIRGGFDKETRKKAQAFAADATRLWILNRSLLITIDFGDEIDRIFRATPCCLPNLSNFGNRHSCDADIDKALFHLIESVRPYDRADSLTPVPPSGYVAYRLRHRKSDGYDPSLVRLSLGVTVRRENGPSGVEIRAVRRRYRVSVG